jgi:hypothetical protein
MEELPRIWRQISPFEAFGVTDTLLKALFTYLEVNSFV